MGVLGTATAGLLRSPPGRKWPPAPRRASERACHGAPGSLRRAGLLGPVVRRPSDRYYLNVREPQTRGLSRRPVRGINYVVLLACLLPFLGVVPGGVLYHCLVTGEYLTACCRDIEAPSVALDVPPCCEEPEEDSDSQSEHVGGTACDCCDVVFEEGQHLEAVHPPGDCGLSQAHLAPVAVAVPVQPLRAFRSIASQRRLRAPPKRPLFLLFESFLS